MKNGKLNKEIQIYIVQQLATFEKPSVVRDSLKENFDIEISLQAVMNYQITNPLFPEKWRELFEATRERFLTEVNDIPIANKSYRVRELNYLYDKQRNAKESLQNPVEMRSTLEQAAKEVGDAFTNRQKIEQSGTVQTVALTLDQWKENAAARTAQAQSAVDDFE